MSRSLSPSMSTSTASTAAATAVAPASVSAPNTRKSKRKRDEFSSDDVTVDESSYTPSEWHALVGGRVSNATFRIGSGNLQPRPHQQRVVTRLVEAVQPLLGQRESGSRNFLIQHSTGSGKSLTLAWLVAELLSVENGNENGGCFDLVLVLNDRRVLDNQISPIVENFLDRVGIARRRRSLQDVSTVFASTDEEERELEDDDDEEEVYDNEDTVNSVGAPPRKRSRQEPVYSVHRPRTGKDLENILSRHAFSAPHAHSRQKTVIVCTLQKFPSVGSHLRNHFARRFAEHGRRIAIIADEAHRSHGKTATAHINDLFGGDTTTGGLDVRQAQPLGLCLFGFTATPAPSALQLFGTRRESIQSKSVNAAHRADVYSAFDVYSMRQAVDDGVILNVLENFTSLVPGIQIKGLPKHVRSRVSLNGGVADLKARATLHDAAMKHTAVILSKAKKIVRHFYREIKSMAPFRPKAMVVCRSRACVVQFCLAIRDEVERVRKKRRLRLERMMNAQPKGRAEGTGSSGGSEAGGSANDFSALMAQCEPLPVYAAFSGEVCSSWNSSSSETGAETPDVRATTEQLMNTVVPFDEARIFIVCNKLETGFDDPQLACMYVDRVLRGAHCVQVMSRLNRIAPRKSRVSIVDFVNTPFSVHSAFSQFWDGTTVSAEESPRLFHSARADTIVSQILSSIAASAKANATSNTTEVGSAADETGVVTSVETVARTMCAAGLSSHILALLDQYSELCLSLGSQKMSLPLRYVQRLAALLRGKSSPGTSTTSSSSSFSQADRLITKKVLQNMIVEVDDFDTEFSGSIRMTNSRGRAALPWVSFDRHKNSHPKTKTMTLSNAVENVMAQQSAQAQETGRPSKRLPAPGSTAASPPLCTSYPPAVVLSMKREIEDMVRVDDSIGLASRLHRLLVVPVSVSTLRITGIGKVINRIAKKKVVNTTAAATSRDVAKQIVLKWKRMVAVSKTAVQSTVQTEAQRRGKARAHLDAAFVSVAKKKSMTRPLPKLAIAVENALYHRWCTRPKGGGSTDFRDYARVLRMLAVNLRRNPGLFESLVDGTLLPEALVTMSAQELATSTQQEERKKTQLENSDLAKFASWKEQVEGERRETARKVALKCPVCGSLGAFVTDMPSTTSMAGVGNQKASAMATFLCCGITRPID